MTVMALNATLKNSDDGSERQTENSDGSEHQNWEAMMALNAKLKSDDGSERQNWEVMKTLNVETEDATLNVDLKTDDGSERRTENMVMALNAEAEKWRWWFWMLIWKPIMALNAKTENTVMALNAET